MFVKLKNQLKAGTPIPVPIVFHTAYSCFNESAGLAMAVLMVWKLTVIMASNKIIAIGFSVLRRGEMHHLVLAGILCVGWKCIL